MSAEKKRGGMGGGLVPGSYPSPEAMRPTLFGQNWSVVAGHHLVSLVAADVFRAGGNAVDAGVAAGIAGNVVQVDMSNFGGIAPILIRPTGSDECLAVAGIGRWSNTANLEEVLNRYGGKLPLEGAPAIVPGAPAGWIRALERFGTMSFGEVAAAAIRLARDGFLLDRRAAQSLEITGRGYGRWPSSAAVYQPQGNPLKAGDRLRQPALGDLLQFMADAEAAAVGTREQKIRAAHEAFYRGEVAEQIATWVQQQGGYLTANDLANFDADVSVGPQLQVGEWTFAATPSWSQGPVALELLGILSRTSGSWHEIAEATTLAFNDREDFFAAPGQMERNISDFLDPEYLASQARRIQAGSALAGRTGERQPKSDGSALGSTTAVVTMDSSGLTFATSPSDTLDGGPIIPSLGIMCSPRGVQNRLDPNHPNRLRPGGRPMVTPAALIGMRGSDSWALACPGGDVIVQAMVQVIRRVLSENLDLQQAVEAPRIAAFNAPSAFHPHPSADRLVYAEARIGEAEIAKLREQGHNVEVWPDFEFDAGSVQTIMSRRNASGEPVLLSAADPRRSAYAISN